jgi:hypothetical protein
MESQTPARVLFSGYAVRTYVNHPAMISGHNTWCLFINRKRHFPLFSHHIRILKVKATLSDRGLAQHWEAP